MFLTFEAIADAINNLKILHPFYGITFLVCKINKLPVGNMLPFPINQRETEFLSTHFRPNDKSKHFYQVFKTSKSDHERWLDPNYSSKGSQRTRTGSDFGKAFIHKKNTDQWAWSKDYIRILAEYLKQQNVKIPAFYLAVWIYKERNFQSEIKAKELIDLLIKEFHLLPDEKKLFDLSIPKINYSLFGENPTTWDELKTIIPFPPDVEPEESGSLAYLEINDIGPSHKFSFEPAERLNLIAGDNGLGKSFLLDCAWWALTGNWAGVPAYPREAAKNPSISFEIAGKGRNQQPVKVSYDWEAYGEDKWIRRDKIPVLPGLCIYARVDGSFAIFDPARRENHSRNSDTPPRTFVFSRKDVRDGYDEERNGRKQFLINGLILDWIIWQNSPDKSAFETLTKVLKTLSPPKEGDLGVIKPGKPIRLSGDSREMPTIEHSYGLVPIVHASAGVQRIITLAYLLVWAWQEHKVNSKAIKKNPEQRIVILIDEIEAHLHPQWQRSILPALLEVGNDLSKDLSLQLMVATHSPMVIGSAAPHYNFENDKLFQIDLVKKDMFGWEAEIEEVDYVNYGRVGSWLTTKDVFELKQDQTSLKAEQAIEKARKLQQEKKPSKEAIKGVSEELFRYLSDLDVFLPRWIAFAAKHGVEL